MPSVLIDITTTLVGGTAMNFALQSAPDNGSNVPGTWTTVVETGAIALAYLTANNNFYLPFSRRQVGSPLPRFYRLLYTPTGTFTAGAVSAGIILGADTSMTLGQYPSNFSLGAGA